jgi:hypothetical protein
MPFRCELLTKHQQLRELSVRSQRFVPALDPIIDFAIKSAAHCNQWSFNQRLSRYLVRDWNHADAAVQGIAHRFLQLQGLPPELPDQRASSMLFPSTCHANFVGWTS